MFHVQYSWNLDFTVVNEANFSLFLKVRQKLNRTEEAKVSVLEDEKK